MVAFSYMGLLGVVKLTLYLEIFNKIIIQIMKMIIQIIEL